MSFAKGALVALFLITVGQFAFLNAADAAEPAPHFSSEPLTIASKAGVMHRFTVELAANSKQREYGLMFRTEMAGDHGMLFDFATSQHVQMWMENTVLPLDMLFLDGTGKITHIVENAVPYSQSIIDSNGPVKYVIELNGGIIKKLGIATGDGVSSPTIDKH
jgi:uncharacterized membrane protein (UPF0127 family)